MRESGPKIGILGMGVIRDRNAFAMGRPTCETSFALLVRSLARPSIYLLFAVRRFCINVASHASRTPAHAHLPQCALGVDLKGDKKEGPRRPHTAIQTRGSPARYFRRGLPPVRSFVCSFPSLVFCSGVSGANAFSRSRDDFWKEGRARRCRLSAVPVQQFFCLLLSHLPLKHGNSC